MKRDATAVPRIDPVTFEVLRMGLDAIADEMAYTIVRSARSTMIKDCMDYSASLCTAHGDLIAQAVNIPVRMMQSPGASVGPSFRLGRPVASGAPSILPAVDGGGARGTRIVSPIPTLLAGPAAAAPRPR